MDCGVCRKPAENQCSACKNVSYCSVECQKKDWKVHKKSCRPFVIKKIDESGTEYLEATRDLAFGTIVFDETPILQIPYNDKGFTCCLSCARRIEPEAEYQNCSKCSWPICSSECEKYPIHRDNECAFFSSKKMECPEEPFRDHWVCLGVRGLMIKKNNKELWDYFQSLGLEEMSIKTWEHYDEDISLIISDLKIRKNVEKKELKETLRLGQKLHALCYSKGFARVLYDDEATTNTTQNQKGRSSKRIKIQGFYMYKTAEKMTQSCSPNLIWHIGDFPDFKIRVRANTPIKKGEKLTFSGLSDSANEILGTIPRGDFLRKKTNFFCKCPRCSSPSEFGTYLSAIRCDSCFLEQQTKQNETFQVEDVNSGYLLPVDPLAYEQDGHFYLWKCNRCDKTTPYTKFVIKILDISREVAVFYAADKHFLLEAAKDFVKKYERNVLHPNHYLLLQTRLLILKFLQSHIFEKLSKRDVFDVQSPVYNAPARAQVIAQVKDGIRRAELLLKVLDKILPGFSYMKKTILKSLAVFKSADRLLLTKFKKQIGLRKIKQSRKELEQLVDYYKDNLPTRRGQENCDEFNFFKCKLDNLELTEKRFLES